MANVREYRRRIRSVKNTQQITRAMKFVAAAKLRRAQDRILSARPYARRMTTVLNSLAARVKAQAGGRSRKLHPLLAERPEQRIVVMLVTADKGLCGAFNNNLIHAALRLLEEKSDKERSVVLVGKKGWDYFKRRRYTLLGEHVNVLGTVSYDHARQIAAPLIEAYSKGKVDAIYVIYNEFKSVLQQRLTVEKLLPIAPLEAEPGEVLIDYIYEQPPEKIFGDLLPKYVEIQVFRTLLESAAAENAARMTAMDAATRNAEDMISSLTLTMNKIRQAAITKEIIEIVSGANALAASTK